MLIWVNNDNNTDLATVRAVKGGNLHYLPAANWGADGNGFNTYSIWVNNLL
jgi:ABC-type enterochelin transport system substrate-binding protein